MRWFFLLLLLLGLLVLGDAATVQLTMQNLADTLQSAQVVFVAFCADWCPFSRRLKPIFEEAAAQFKRDKPNASAVWAIVDSVQQVDVADKFFVNKYPTMKVFVNGELITKEYRSTRSVEALTEFVQKQLDSAIVEFKTQEELDSRLDASRRNVVGKFPTRGGPEFTNFQKVAALLKDDCVFYLSTGDIQLSYSEPDGSAEQKFSGNFGDYDYVKQWLTDKCIPLVREVTFENVEELTEEGLPFLIYFRDPKKKDQDKVFVDQVVRELYDQKASVNALLADGHKFAHPLKHLGKTINDLPVLAIDSFQHMFIFHDMSQLTVPGKLREFVMDLHSGKLHKEFHETLDQKMIDLAKFQEANPDKSSEEGDAPGQKPSDTTPVASIFKELKPSDRRYSLLSKTEL